MIHMKCQALFVLNNWEQNFKMFPVEKLCWNFKGIQGLKSLIVFAGLRL